MAKAAGPSKPAKRTRAEKKAARAAKRQSRRDTWRAMGQAFTLTRKNDPRFIPYLVIFGVGAAAVVYVVSFFVTGSPWYGIPIAVAAGLLAATVQFSRRAQKSMYSQAEGHAGRGGMAAAEPGPRRLAHDTDASPAPPNSTPCTGWSADPAWCWSARVRRTGSAG